MALETCVCGVRFAVGLLRCPRCGVIAPRFAARTPAELPARVSGRSMPTLRGEHGPEATFRQLRAIAKSRGLSGAGTADELKARIAEHDAAQGGGAP